MSPRVGWKPKFLFRRALGASLDLAVKNLWEVLHVERPVANEFRFWMDMPPWRVPWIDLLRGHETFRIVFRPVISFTMCVGRGAPTHGRKTTLSSGLFKFKGLHSLPPVFVFVWLLFCNEDRFFSLVGLHRGTDWSKSKSTYPKLTERLLPSRILAERY